MDTINNNYKNYGIIMGRQASDFAGGVIPYEIRNPSGDWKPYLVVGEIQRSTNPVLPDADWMDCTCRSFTNCVEIQEKFLTGKESNYNDREVAVGCGVTRQGAYLWQPAEYVRKTGLAQQSTWPDSNGKFDEQYTLPADSIMIQLKAEKSDWLNKWSILHEDIPYDKASLQKHLKHAPIQVVIPGHAITLILSLDDVDRIFDSYPPYEKDVPGANYPGPIVYAKKIVLYKKEEAMDPDTLLIDLKKGDTGSQVLRAKRALRRLGWFSAVDTDIYDDDFADLVMRFSLSNVHDYMSWDYLWERYYHKGSKVGPKHRIIINNSLKYRK